ncbi:replicative DNA helicase [Enterobacter hormaechei]|uniref:replicative DNA helicase n=1 Tax=Enterobacter hormaechei TaxID=158836 RepID=UPI0007A90841|nr:replicative DNA helicase [Enterobacter hormaechei]SAI93476.1 Replicative DNA helicase [Enterobacter hormaechei]
MNPVWKNDELEGAVIGAMLLRGADPDVLDIISHLSPGVFSVRQYRDIYAGICRQVHGSGIIDPLLLCDTLPELQSVILDTSRVHWAKSAIIQYVGRLQSNAAVRDAEATLEKVLFDIKSATNGAAALAALESAKQVMADISVSPDTVQPVHIDDILPEVVERIEARMQGLESGRTLMTGIEDLDARTGGIDLTDLVIIGARPSMGKTELVLDIIDKVSAQGYGVLFFSMEMANLQITERMLSAAGGMAVSRLKAADRFDDEDWARISNGMGYLTGRKIWMVDATNLTAEQICQTATQLKLQHPEIALVAIDYLMLIKVQSTARHDLGVGEISKTLKRLAKSNNTPVIALSQLSRGVETRMNKRPMNSDLKNSGEIEADADLIMMLYRDEVYDPESPARGIAEINITKQRNGELGTIYRRFLNGHFLPIDQEEAKRRSAQQVKPQGRRYSKSGHASNADF